MNPEERQLRYWEKEHAAGNPALPSIGQPEPGRAVIEFVEFLRKRQGPQAGTVVDLGCGKGRNTLYLAQQGFHVHAVDYVDTALKEVVARAHTATLTRSITVHRAYISDPWPFPDAFFDLAIDNYSSIDIESSAGRERCVSEMLRCLKPGGYACVAVIAADDDFESSAEFTAPAGESNSVIWKGENKFQKNYSLEEIERVYRDFHRWEIKKIRKPVTKLGRNFISADFVAFLQKPLGPS